MSHYGVKRMRMGILTGLKFGTKSKFTRPLALNCGMTPNVGRAAKLSWASYVHCNSASVAPIPRLYKITSRSVNS